MMARKRPKKRADDEHEHRPTLLADSLRAFLSPTDQRFDCSRCGQTVGLRENEVGFTERADPPSACVCWVCAFAGDLPESIWTGGLSWAGLHIAVTYGPTHEDCDECGIRTVYDSGDPVYFRTTTENQKRGETLCLSCAFQVDPVIVGVGQSPECRRRAYLVLSDQGSRDDE